jgi:uncharacterized protein (TIGR01319 family)
VVVNPVAAGERGVLVADFGSTFTKLALVQAQSGRIVAFEEQPTTAGIDIWLGLERGREEIARHCPDVTVEAVHACSSAGGGLRVAVIGLEPDLTARAGRYAAMSAGARVVEVVAGTSGPAAARRVSGADPDIVLLTGGFDGGDRNHLLTTAESLKDAGIEVPVVVAGNGEASAGAVARLAGPGRVAVRAAT